MLAVRTRCQTRLLAFFVWLGALRLAADASFSADEKGPASGGPGGGATGVPPAATLTPGVLGGPVLVSAPLGPHAHDVSSSHGHELAMTTMGGPLTLSATSTSPRGRGAVARPPAADIGPLPPDYFLHSSVGWDGVDALPKPRALPRGAILYHGSTQFDMRTLGTRPLWLSPQSSAALAAAFKKCFQTISASSLQVATTGPCPGALTVQLFEFVVATDVLDVVYLPHSSLKVQATLNTYASGNPFREVTMGRPSDLVFLPGAITKFCADNSNTGVHPRSFFGWRSPFDQDEVMVCPWRIQTASHQVNQLYKSIISRPVRLPPQTGSGPPPPPPQTHTGPPLPPPQTGSAAGSRPLVLLRQFSCYAERIRLRLLAAHVGTGGATARGKSLADCRNMLEVTYDFNQVRDPRTSSMLAISSTGFGGTASAPNWSALSAFHMQLADGLSIAQLLTPLAEGEEPPCVQVGDYTAASIDQSLAAAIEAVAEGRRRLTDPF